MNLQDLRYFKEVAQELNITSAAANLYLSQQNLSQRIKQLEEYYQVALFERRPTFRLTFAGERLLEYARQLEADEDRLMADLSEIREEGRGRLVFGIPPTRTPIVIPPLLTRFKRRYPNVEFSLKERPTASLEEGLLNGDIDLAVGVFSAEACGANPCLETTVLLEETVYLAVPNELLERHFPDRYPACVAAFREGVLLKDFLRLPVILYPRHNRMHTEIQEYYRRHGARPNVLVEAFSGASLISLCLEGLSCIFLPHMFRCHLFDQDPGMKNRLNYFPIRDCLSNSRIVLIRHRDRRMSKYMNDLVQITQEVFLQFQRD